MLFYMCETKALPGYTKHETRDAEHQYAREQRAKVEEFNRENTGSYFGFINKISAEKTYICFASGENTIPDDMVKEFIVLLTGSTDLSYSLKEITMKAFAACAEESSRRDFADDSDDIFSALDIDDISHHNRSSYSEGFISKPVSKAQLIKRANAILCGETLIPEIERIYAGTAASVKGHPVHYMIQCDDRKTSTEITDILMAALVTNNRVISKRYVTRRFGQEDSIGNEFRCLCKSTIGGAIVVICDTKDSDDTEFANRGADILTNFAVIARKHRNKLLSILCLPRKCDRMADVFLDNTGAMNFITIKEEVAFNDSAKAYMKKLAKQEGVTPDRGLYKAIEPGKGYSASDLELIFEKWFDKHLVNNVYIQYKAIGSAEARQSRSKPRGSAFSELDEMIGLASAKEVIKQAIDFYRAQKLYSDLGIDSERPAMHMVFTGNPGTAKTSVARLFARIMKENDLLSVGDLREVGRADLVDRFVGGTAPRVRGLFKRTRGSVLFIDEAYSLVDDRDGMFGDEAINTIVQEMENSREDMVVIFAGYPDKMEEFLCKNPGLRSRIAFHVNFKDYGIGELCDILELMVKNHKMSLGGGVIEKVTPILENALKNQDFGNGRFVRNLFEKAKLKQASRLVAMDVESVTKSDALTLISDDFEAPEEQRRSVNRIGFFVDEQRAQPLLVHQKQHIDKSAS